MISSISNGSMAQNIAMVNANNNVNSKATEEANESPSERKAESNHKIDSYA